MFRWTRLNVTFILALPVLFLVYHILSALSRNQLHEWSVFGSGLWWWRKFCSLPHSEPGSPTLLWSDRQCLLVSLREECQKGDFAFLCLVLKPRQLYLYFDARDMNLFLVLSRGNIFLCGNKMPTRCNRGFYCRSYCLLNMFRASLCPSSGDQEYYTVVAACGILCCDFFK